MMYSVYMAVTLLLNLYLQPVSALRVCSRKRYVFASSAVLQRVHMPTHERCVERCIENIRFCRAAVFTPYNEKSIGVCTLYSENTIQQPTALHPDASVEPVSTVHELLQTCPQYSLSEITYKISANHRKKLEHHEQSGRASEEGDMRADAFFPDRDQFVEDTFRLTADRYATMTPLYPDTGPKKPSSRAKSSRNRFPYTESRDGSPKMIHETRDFHKPKSPFDGLPAIVPVAVLHMGQALKQPYESCLPGASCVPTLASLDSSPCPARQNDPCAPRPACYPTACVHSDAQTVVSTWMEWSPCSQSCGSGTRTRQCAGVGCIGPTIEPCILVTICQEWSPWGSWTGCSVTCGEGERKRTRECIGGRDCPGVSVTVETCATVSCPIWTEWGPWEGCSVTCGPGQERRNRKCQSGAFCPGPAEEVRSCNIEECPQWNAWSSWTTCTKSCDTGETIRTRECSSKKGCEGGSEERLLCNQHDCPKWTEWTAWTVCSNKCDEETYRIRNRVCMYRGMAHAGCEGAAQDQSSCPTRPCPTWAEWGEWSECTSTCGQGNQHRTRTCDNGSDCPGSNREIRFCQLASCPYWDEWMPWSGCSVTCGIGVCERRRKCVTDDLLNLPTLEELDEALFEMDSGQADKAKSMLIARSKSKGGNIANRNQSTEDAARRAPSRTVIEGGGTCVGSDVERKPCDAGPCCSWGSWSEWSPCTGCGPQAVSRRTRTCMTESTATFSSYMSQGDYRRGEVIRGGGGGGRQTSSSDTYASPPLLSDAMQSLTPIVPVNQHRIRRHSMMFQTGTIETRVSKGGQCCEGPAVETRPCNIQCETPRPCAWSEWSEWCGCVRCHPGKETRRRYCDRSGSKGEVSRTDPSCHCSGRDSEERECIVERICDAMRQPEGGGAPAVESYDKPPNEEETYATSYDRSNEYRNQGQNYRTAGTYRKDTAITTTTFSYPICRWSKWSEWSSCDDSKKRHRTRFCIGSDTLVSDCECMGFSTENDHCNSMETTTKIVNEVDFNVAKAGSEPGMNTDDETKLDENIQSALKVDESYQNRNEVSLIASVIKTEKCEWTRWSQWSTCTVSCGTGERLRKRRCPCGDNQCGAGVDQETTKCSEWKCDRKMPPVFKID